jgi:hypothetical protein
MTKDDLEIMMRAVLQGVGDSDILNSKDPVLIVLYRIFCFVYLKYRTDNGYSKVRLKAKKSIIWTQNLPLTNIKVINTTHDNLCEYHYIITQKKIILFEYRDLFSNLEKIYNILKENP